MGDFGDMENPIDVEWQTTGIYCFNKMITFKMWVIILLHQRSIYVKINRLHSIYGQHFDCKTNNGGKFLKVDGMEIFVV